MIKTNIINKNNNNFIMLPKVDYCFKEIMKDIYVLKGFLSAILNIVFFSIENKEELDAMYGKNEYIDKACDHIKELSADEKKKLEYDIRFKALSDHNTQIHSSYNRGVKAGIEEGQFNTTAKPYNSGKISLEDAIEELNITKDEFLARLDEI